MVALAGRAWLWRVAAAGNFDDEEADGSGNCISVNGVKESEHADEDDA